MTKITKYFETLSADEILQETPAKWSDPDLLDVLELFEELNDTERKTAVLELILSSPDNSQMVDYSELLHDLIYCIYVNEKNFAKATYWAVAALTFEIQHNYDPIDIQNNQRTLAEIHLLKGDLDTGLQMSIRLLQADPADSWTYNMLGEILPGVGLPKFALTALKRGLKLTNKDDITGIIDILQENYDALLKTTETAVSPPPDIHPDTIAKFNHTFTKPPPPAEYLDDYQAPILDLLFEDEPLDENIRLSIKAQGKVLIPELIQLAFDEDYWGTAVNRHVISLLQQIHDTEPSLASLSHWLEQATDENWPQLLCKYTGKIGGFTTPDLQALIADTNLDAHIRNAASESLLARLESTPGQRTNIIEFCRTLLTREEAYEASEELFIALLISNITDTDAKELYPEIKQVFDKDRLDPTITDLPYIHEKWDMPPLPSAEIREDGLSVTLECEKCHRTRRYFVQHVTIDITTLAADLEDHNVPYDPHIMDRPIVCPKCGIIDQYKIDPITRMRLAMGNNPENILARLMEEEPANTSPPDPFVSQVRPQAFGQDMHPLVALNKYKQIALNHPKDAEPHWRMGNILRSIWRDEQAREAYKRSIELDSKELYSYYCLAATEHDLGNLDEAQTLYQKTMKLIPLLEMMRNEESMSISMTAAEGLKALKDGLPSPYTQEYRMPKEEPKLSRKERRAEKKRLRKLNKKNKQKRR